MTVRTTGSEGDEVFSITKCKFASRVRAKDVFFATMSHDVRTPVTGILGVMAPADSVKGGVTDRLWLRKRLLPPARKGRLPAALRHVWS
jgi:signal transduction histidine kinase